MTRKGELDAETKSCDREIKVDKYSLLDYTCTNPHMLRLVYRLVS